MKGRGGEEEGKRRGESRGKREGETGVKEKHQWVASHMPTLAGDGTQTGKVP